MKDNKKIQRFVFQTDGVCSPEIHFQIVEGLLKDIRFVGGGCPGNARLVSRLLEGRPLEEVAIYLDGIECRNDTSCPDQLAMAIKAVKEGDLHPTDSFRIQADPDTHARIGFVGEPAGDDQAMEKIVSHMVEMGVNTVYCLGNLTGNSHHNRELIRFVRKRNILAVQGARDWQYAQGAEGDLPSLTAKERDWLLRLPHVLEFRLGGRKGITFFGEYIQDFPGFSDYEPFALEMNMVCGLTNFMQDETVFPALEAMVPQFQADIIVFSQQKKWGHWQVAEKEFVSIGPAAQDSELAWGLLESGEGNFEFKTVQI